MLWFVARCLLFWVVVVVLVVFFCVWFFGCLLFFLMCAFKSVYVTALHELKNFLGQLTGHKLQRQPCKFRSPSDQSKVNHFQPFLLPAIGFRSFHQASSSIPTIKLPSIFVVICWRMRKRTARCVFVQEQLGIVPPSLFPFTVTQAIQLRTSRVKHDMICPARFLTFLRFSRHEKRLDILLLDTDFKDDLRHDLNFSRPITCSGTSEMSTASAICGTEVESLSCTTGTTSSICSTMHRRTCSCGPDTSERGAGGTPAVSSSSNVWEEHRVPGNDGPRSAVRGVLAVFCPRRASFCAQPSTHSWNFGGKCAEEWWNVSARNMRSRSCFSHEQSRRSRHLQAAPQSPPPCVCGRREEGREYVGLCVRLDPFGPILKESLRAEFLVFSF